MAGQEREVSTTTQTLSTLHASFPASDLPISSNSVPYLASSSFSANGFFPAILRSTAADTCRHEKKTCVGDGDQKTGNVPPAGRQDARHLRRAGRREVCRAVVERRDPDLAVLLRRGQLRVLKGFRGRNGCTTHKKKQKQRVRNEEFISVFFFEVADGTHRQRTCRSTTC
jgi:hypothetical protein